ncbi:MAG: hypothetical protein P8R34_00840, partial [archaeon]|nr:hypothetical protein [archaeon]
MKVIKVVSGEHYLLYSNSTSLKLNPLSLQPVWHLQHPFAVAYSPSTRHVNLSSNLSTYDNVLLL